MSSEGLEDVLSENLSTSTVWARRRLGGAAAELERRIPHAMALADQLAYRASVAAEVETGDVYGTAFWVKSNTALIEHAESVPGVVIRRLQDVKLRFRCVVVEETSTAVIPVTLQPSTAKQEGVRLKSPASASRLTLLGPPVPKPEPETLDNALFGLPSLAAEQVAVEEVDGQLADLAGIVWVGVECSMNKGVSRIRWGDLKRVGDESLWLRWAYDERIDHIGRESSYVRPEEMLAAVGGMSSPTRPTSFDRGTDGGDDLDLSLRDDT